METNTLQVPALNWSKEKHRVKSYDLKTYEGYTATPDSKWWEWFKKNKEQCRALGLRMVPLRCPSCGADGSAKWLVVRVVEETPEERAKLIEQSRAGDSSIEVPCPPGLSYLPYQKAGIDYARNHLNVLFGDEMGLGKTIEAIGVLNDNQKTLRRVLVVCPAYLKLNWRSEMDKWIVGKKSITIIDSGDKLPTPEIHSDRMQVTIINYEILQKYVEEMPIYDCMIVDECHYAKNLKAKRTKAVHSVKAERIMCLTGTPMLNRPIELYPILKLLVPGEFGNEFQFAKRYCDGKDNGWGFEAKGCTHANELQQRLRASCMIRRLKMDVLKELPPKRRQVIPLPPTAEIKRLLNEEMKKWELHEETLAKLVHRKSAAEISKDDGEYKQACGLIAKQMRIAFTEMALIRVRLSELKVPIVENHIKGLFEGGLGKVIVFWHHKGAAKLLSECWNQRDCVLITGDVDASERHDLVERFQKDKDCRMCVGTIGAMGTGLTLTAASTVVFGELDWRPGILAQAEDRAHRIGQNDAVLAQYLLFEESLDAKMIHTVIEKMENAYKVLDGDEPDEPETNAPEARKERKLPDWGARGKLLTDEQCDMVVECIRKMAYSDSDKARIINGVGFNKIDSHIGQDLASKPSLSRGEIAYAHNMLRKYHRQLGSTACAVLGFDKKEE